MRIKILIYILIAISFEACIEEFNPKIKDYIDLLVVEGIITNEQGPYIVKLSKTIPVYNSITTQGYIPVSDANVIISDDNNTEETLFEIEPGVYSTNETGIHGMTGRKYRITININGKTYQSNYEEIEEPVLLDSLYAKIEYHDIDNNSYEGLQFYIDTENIDSKLKYLLWFPVETYEFTSDVVIDSIYTPGSYWIETNPFVSTRFIYDWTDVCWRTENIYESFSFATKNIQGSKISNYPLHYVNTETKKLLVKYSVEVNQYSVSEDEYRYWTEIGSLNSESGSMYDSQPFQVNGNLVNIDNPDDIILGYFMTAGVSHKRIFVDPPLLNFYYDYCEPDVASFQTMLNFPAIRTYPMYSASSEQGEPGLVQYECGDCRTKGSNIKPDFWVD